jgi:IstB-like ATP binding protein
MLTHPTHDRLIALGLTGMAKAMEDQRRQPDIAALAFEERIAMMIDREAIERENKRLATRLKFACLRQSAIVEDVDMKALRGLDKTLFQKLAAGDWIDQHQNLIVIGPPERDSYCSSLDLLKNPTLSDADCQTTDAEVGGPELLG